MKFAITILIYRLRYDKLVILSSVMLKINIILFFMDIDFIMVVQHWQRICTLLIINISLTLENIGQYIFSIIYQYLKVSMYIAKDKIYINNIYAFVIN